MSLVDFQGQVVLLIFWGSWCGPCMEMVPHERELAQRYRGKPFALVGVNCGDTRDVAKATMERHHMTWRSRWDGDETRGPSRPTTTCLIGRVCSSLTPTASSAPLTPSPLTSIAPSRRCCKLQRSHRP